MRISVIIPTLNEQAHIHRTVTSSWQAGADEVIVCDGGSHDRTLRIAKSASATICHSSCGRGIQMNAGADQANGDVLLFLHADNWPGPQLLNQIRRAVKDPAIVWGGFRQRIDNRRLVYRLIELGNRCRLAIRKLAYGDQAIFVRREIFIQVGRFQPIPLMEDVCLSRNLNRIAKPVLLPGPLHVDARRWESRGPVRTTIQNWSLYNRFVKGVPVQQLAREYYGTRIATRVTTTELAESKKFAKSKV